jgi:hypothetical protein
VFFQLDPASFYVVVLPVIFFFYWEGLFINGLALSTTCRQLMSSLIEYELETMDVGIETCLLLVKGAWGWQYSDSSCWRSKEFGKILQLVRMTVPAIQLKIVYFRPLIKKNASACPFYLSVERMFAITLVICFLKCYLFKDILK